MKPFVPFLAAGFLISTAAMAQNAKHNDPAASGTADQSTAAATTPDSATNTPASTGRHLTIRQDVKDSLQQAGFTNVRVMPDSFLVQAKDKSGHPVAMIINPNSMTEVVDEGAVGQAGSSGQTASNTAATADNDGSQPEQTFTTVAPTQTLSSKIVGTAVYDNSNQDIGTIKDIAYGQSGVKAYIVGVGGFLGMGDHYVAVEPSAIKLDYDHANNSWKAEMNTTASALKAAPEYKYPNAG